MNCICTSTFGPADKLDLIVYIYALLSCFVWISMISSVDLHAYKAL